MLASNLAEGIIPPPEWPIGVEGLVSSDFQVTSTAGRQLSK